MSGHPDWTEVYRASGYACFLEGGWRCFALDAEDGADALNLRSTSTVTLITAWNPDSIEIPRPRNEAANARLLRRLVADQVPWSLAFGASLPQVEPSWKEDGYAIHGLDRDQACRWGRAWGQRAVVWLAPGASELLFCQSGETVTCRLRTLELSDWVLPSAVSA